MCVLGGEGVVWMALGGLEIFIAFTFLSWPSLVAPESWGARVWILHTPGL